ncbi:hypothetical protein MNBD_ALPHA01-1775 [hydrothermal vent metagenome]|uniref:MobA-like NTP transferase domain-containing protein n=1 Tax=hydrothermal vent metagenome TaxID=652676 RepID=A0A3B0SGK5_9ZZZZ
MKPPDGIKPLGVIIAGGQSRRFNETSQNPDRPVDKFLMAFGSTTLLGHIIDRAKRQIPHLILNSNGDPDRLQPFGLDIISDEIKDVGPLGGILSAMKAAQAGGHSHIISFSSDSPFFPDDYVARLVGAVQKNNVRIAISQSWGVKSRGKSEIRSHPVMGIYEVSLQDDLGSYIKSGGRRVLPWINQQPHEKVVWDTSDPDPFFNINRPEELAEAEKFL